MLFFNLTSYIFVWISLQFTSSDGASTDVITDGPGVTEKDKEVTSADADKEATPTVPEATTAELSKGVEVIVVQSWNQGNDLGVEFYVNNDCLLLTRMDVDGILRSGIDDLKDAFNTTVWWQAHVKRTLSPVTMQSKVLKVVSLDSSLREIYEVYFVRSKFS